MAKEKTQKYIVIKKHTLGHEINAEIDLTELGAKALIGKVRLKSDQTNDNKLASAAGKLKEENTELKSEIDELKSENAKLTAELEIAKSKIK